MFVRQYGRRYAREFLVFLLLFLYLVSPRSKGVEILSCKSISSSAVEYIDLVRAKSEAPINKF